MIYTGAGVLEGIQYDFARLNTTINIAAVNGDGTPVTTGWESVPIFVTDCKFDFENQPTTLTFSSDQMQLAGVDPAMLKARLGIHSLVRFEDDWLAGFIGFNSDSLVYTVRDIRYVDRWTLQQNVPLNMPHGAPVRQ